MNDTPISDAAWHWCGTKDDGSDVQVVPLDLARRLERDRAELMEALRRGIYIHDLITEHARPVSWDDKEQARAFLSRLEKD